MSTEIQTIPMEVGYECQKIHNLDRTKIKGYLEIVLEAFDRERHVIRFRLNLIGKLGHSTAELNQCFVELENSNYRSYFTVSGLPNFF